MADPLTILGTASAVATIVEIITTTMKTLKQIHDRWKDADLTIVNLISQLASLRAALTKITEWISSDLADNPQHHQLVIDLEQSIDCCYMLMQSMQLHLSKLDWSNNKSSLDFSSRIRVVFDDKASKDFQKFVKRQTSALTLLLTACSCKTLSEQGSLLESSHSREALKQIKDDSASLIVLYDATSISSVATQSTGVSSRLSMIFQFDSELMSSQVYQRAIRSLLRKPIDRVKSIVADQSQERLLKQKSDLSWKEQGWTSKRIEEKIMSDKPTGRTGLFALVGRPSEAKDSLISHLRSISIESEKYLLSRKAEVIFASVDSLRALLDKFENEGELSNRLSESLATSKDTLRARVALIIAWQDLWDRLRVEKGSDFIPYVETCIYPRPFYFLEHFRRIVEPDFIPVKQDVSNLPEDCGIQHLNLKPSVFPCRILNTESLGADWREWAPRFVDVDVMIYVVDMNSYDQREKLIDGETGPSTAMEESLEIFIEMANSQWFPRTTILLLLYDQHDRFASKFHRSPLSKFQPGYRGGNDDIKYAAEYLARLFFRKALQTPHRQLRWHFAGSRSEGVLEFLEMNMRNVIFAHHLRASGIVI